MWFGEQQDGLVSVAPENAVPGGGGAYLSGLIFDAN
jgi:hypothetical protein